MPMKPFSHAVNDGPVVVALIEPPAGAELGAFVSLAEGLRNRVSAFLVADNPTAQARLSALTAAHVLADREMETVVAFSCRDRNRLALASDLLAAEALGLCNVLAVTGDHPSLGSEPGARPVYDLDSVQLLEMIRGLNQGRRPDGGTIDPPTRLFAGATVNPEVHSPEGQMLKFRLKAQAGAGFFFSQAIFHPERFETLAAEARGLNVKVLAGLRLIGPEEAPMIAAKLRPWLNLPPEIAAELAAAPDKALDRSLELALKTASALKGRTDGFVVMAPGLAKELPDIIERLNLV